MKNIGNILILDSVSSMNRDRINFEDRILYNLKYKNKDKNIFSRTLSAKTAPMCLSLLRRRSFDYKHFVSGVDEARAYIVLGLAEENHTITKKWFETTIHHLIDELLFMDIDPCIVSCRKKTNFKNEIGKNFESKKQIYINKNNWNSTSCYSLNMISKQRKIDIIKCDISFNGQWDTISSQSINLLGKLYQHTLIHQYNQ